MKSFRQDLLKTDVIPRKLNDVSKKYRKLFLEDLESEKIKTEDVKKCQCGSSHLEQLTKIDRFGLPFGSLICRGCGLVITSPRICEESLPYYYDKYYHPLNYGREHLKNQTALFADGQGIKIFNILRDYLPKKEKLKVLEVGAGTGNVLAEFRDEAKRYDINIEELGTEYNNDCIIKAKKDNNINIIFGNIQTVVERAETFDVIILSHVFEHFINLTKELENLKKLISKETLLYIGVPGIFDLSNNPTYNFDFIEYTIHAHMYNFNLNSLERVLNHSHFRMLYGNECIDAIFKEDLCVKNLNRRDNYNDTINYLNKLNDASLFLFNGISKGISNSNNILQQNKDYGSRLLQKIENRDKTLEKKDEFIKKQELMIENRDKIINDISLIISKMEKFSVLQNPFNFLKKIQININKINKLVKYDE